MPSSLSTPDPEFLQLVQRGGLARAVPEPVSFPASTLKIFDTQIPSEGASIAVRSYVPQPSAEHGEKEGHTYPVLTWTHGGGFNFGDLDMDHDSLQLLAVDLRLSIVNIEYRTAQAALFPAAVHDSYAALRWTVNNQELLHADIKKGLINAGVTSGANLALSRTNMARDDPELKGKVTGQVIQMPLTVFWDVYPEKYKSELTAAVENKDAPILPADRMFSLLKNYAPDPKTHLDPRASPLLLESHAGLPPTYFQVAGWDPLRDDAIVYERVLREAGVKTKMDMYPGLPHIFHMWAPKIQASIKWEKDVREGIRWVLAQTPKGHDEL